MRIISGTAGGRKLLAPQGPGIRPTSGKVRGAIFNALRSKRTLEDIAVMDCFCGSGALGLEALSNGARYCLFIDNNCASLALAKENAENLKLEKAGFLFADASKLKTRPQQNEKAALAFLDPPYNKSLIVPALEALHAGAWLENGAVCVIEAEKNFKDVVPAAFLPLDEKFYGDTRISFLRYTLSKHPGESRDPVKNGS
jgi:16S rRNA (guanine966-N2)-methyltransferase